MATDKEQGDAVTTAVQAIIVQSWLDADAWDEAHPEIPPDERWFHRAISPTGPIAVLGARGDAIFEAVR